MADLDRPTQIAEAYFSAATVVARNSGHKNILEPRDLAYILGKFGEGFGQMAIGLRATYILLEEVRNLLQRQKT